MERAAAVVAGDGFVALAASMVLRKVLGPEARIAMLAEPQKPGAADGRSFAVAASSRQLLSELGVWQALQAQAQPILEIVVTDSRLDDVVRPSLLSFARKARSGAYAHMVDAAGLGRALADGAREAGIERLAARIRGIEADEAVIRISVGGELSIGASLLVAADGARSHCRELAGIGWVGRRYEQVGLTGTILHERDHGGRAYEHFLPAGPFAVLPLKGRRSSIVWAEGAREATRLLALDESDLSREIARRAGHGLGALRLEGRLAAYPLSFGAARSFIGPRLALVGDAAHVVHPVAGQGFNLGLRDVAALAEAVRMAARLGLDPGSPFVLSPYQRSRRFDTTVTGAAMDGLVRLFSNDFPPFRALRDLGLGIVDRLPLAKRFLAMKAAGSAAPVARRARAARKPWG